jgi:hypothetical protein
MSEQKKKAGRPPKYGDDDTKKIIKSNAQKLLIKAKEVYKNDPAWAINLGALQWIVSNPDLVKEDSIEGIAKAIQDHPELRINLLYRADPENSDLTNIMLDAALRAGIVRVLQDQHLKDLRDNTTEKDKRVLATKAIAAKLVSENQGKRPRDFWKKLAKELKPNFGDVSKSTSDRDLKA